MLAYCCNFINVLIINISNEIEGPLSRLTARLFVTVGTEARRQF